jgi:exodeoxyribonuclease-3
MVWDDAFREHLKKLDQVKPVVACGDLNVAHKEIDLKNPKTNTQSAGFTPEERAKMTLLLESGFADTFRVLHPDQAEAYTWWSYIGAARKRNTGWRIDYFLVSDRIKDKVLAASIHSDVYGSDHCPVSLELDL